MWGTMICPLFNALLVFLYFEKSEAYHQQMLRLWRQSFKKFMLIPKSTSSDLVDEMIGIDLIELINFTVLNSGSKWYARSFHKLPDILTRIKPNDYLKGIPKEWCLILKQQFSLCPLCKNCIRNAQHMESQHKIELAPAGEIWEAIKEMNEYQTKKQEKKNPTKKVKRQVFLEYWKPKLQYFHETTAEKYKNIYSNKSVQIKP